jgi:hypothetical protein
MLERLKELIKSPAILFLALIASLFTFTAGTNVFLGPEVISSEEAIRVVLQDFPETLQKGDGHYYFTDQISKDWFIAIGYSNNQGIIISGECFKVRNNTAQFINVLTEIAPDTQRIDPVDCVSIV